MTPAQFLSLAEVLPEPTLLIESSGRVLAANAAVRLLGLSPAELCGRFLSQCASESELAITQYLTLCARSRTLVVGALTLAFGSKKGLVCRLQGAVVRAQTDRQHSLILLRMVPRDQIISQFLLLNEKIGSLNKEVKRRQQAEEDIRREKEWLQVTLNSIGDAVIATSPEGTIVFMNPVAQCYLGCDERSSIGRPLNAVFRIINEYTREPVDNPVSEVIKHGAVVGLANHTILLHPDGSERPIEDSAAPIKDECGKILGVILVFHDVTQQRLAERELRTADRRKDEFLATLAHELRNPLAPIRNSLAILKRLDTASDPAVCDAHEIMERQLTHMVRLIDDLLDLSRISRGKFELRHETIELGRVLQQAIETCLPLAECSGHKLNVSLPERPVHLVGDADRLSQVFINLLNNACKFTPPKGQIQLLTEADDVCATICVRDNGVGIPDDHLSTIFEMFSQVDSSLERSQGGLGIGLTLAKQIIELHSGTIKAESSGKGAGSQFIVQLPIASTKPETRAAHSVRQESPKTGRRILVVDDNRDSAVTLALLLKLSGYITHMAFDGSDALRATIEFEPEIVILDIGLPIMNGYDVCRAVRAGRHGEEITLIALTGWGQEDDRKKAADAGFDAHLTKPVDIAALRHLIEQF